MQEREQVRLRPQRRPEATAPQFAVDCHHRNEGQADRGEIAKPGEIVTPVRIDHSNGGRKLLVGLVMIDDDDIQAEPICFGQRLHAGGAAIHRDQQFRAALRERADRIHIRAIAFENAVGDVHQRIEPACAQEQREQRRRSRAIHVVIAEDRDALAALHGIGDSFRRGLHGIQHKWVRHQPLDGGVEKGLHLIDLDIPAGQDARQHLRQAMPLRDGERPRRTALIEPVAPGTLADGALNAEKEAVRKGDVHGRFRDRARNDLIRFQGRLISPDGTFPSPCAQHGSSGQCRWLSASPRFPSRSSPCRSARL